MHTYPLTTIYEATSALLVVHYTRGQKAKGRELWIGDIAEGFTLTK